MFLCAYYMYKHNVFVLLPSHDDEESLKCLTIMLSIRNGDS